jgi:quinohemoprotein ethanol dehydrogenase
MRRSLCLRYGFMVVLLTVLIVSSPSSLWSVSDGNSYSGGEWNAPGGDAANTRYSTLDQINSKNIKQLGGAWSVEVPDKAEATPLVVNGRMFVVLAQGQILALNPSTGETLWTFTPPQPFSGKRGIGIGDGLLFAGLRDSNVIAVSQETGKLVWMSHHGPEIPSQGMAAAPAYGNGVVVAVVSLGDNFMRGRAIAFDAKNGNVLWSWDAVPAPGQAGHETWPESSDIWKYGGGAMWTTPAIDSKLGLVYLETGNAVPQYGGELRPGDNLYDNCAVALDLKTGKMRWYFQTTHHDVWEGDLSTPLVLYDAMIDGQPRKLVAAMRTDGYLFLFDRETGKPILPIEERPVKQDDTQKTSPTQPYPAGAEEVGPPCVPQDLVPKGFIAGCFYDPLRLDTPNQYMPHMNMRQSPMSYSPQTNDLYGVACVGGSWLRRGPTGWEFIRSARPPGATQYGLLAAVDAKTAKIAWEKRLPWAECNGSGGSLATAGGLLFHLEPDGVFYAYDAKTGDVLWHFQTGQVGVGTEIGPSAASAMTYTIGGQQFIAIANSRTVMAFKVGGSLPEFPTPTPPPTTRAWEGKVVDTGMIEIGTKRVFNITSADKKIDYMDDYGLNPTRARVATDAKITFTNTTQLTQTVEARDGSWTTGPIQPGASASVTIAKSGVYEYVGEFDPWMIGQLIVESSPSASTNPANGGIFTAQQAQRGHLAYTQSCAACHLDSLSGTDRNPPLAGPAFMMNWKDKTVADLYNRVRMTMPQGSAGSLSSQTYADIIAYVLQSNNFPAGASELGTNPDEMSHVLRAK